MENKSLKDVREIRLLYMGLVALAFVALFLAFMLFFLPASPFRRPSAPAVLQPAVDTDQLKELFSAPPGSVPIEVSSEALDSLTGNEKPIVPSQELMDMLSAPPPKK